MPIGFLPSAYSNIAIYGADDNSTLEPTFEEYQSKNPWPRPITVEWGMTKDSYEAMTNQLLMFDQPPLVDDLPPTIERAYQLVLQMHKDKGIESEVLDIEDIEITFSSSSGYEYQKIYGNKGDFLKDPIGMMEVQQFWDCAHVMNLEPLWKVSTKHELLSKEKINKRNLRCFEIPPLPFVVYGARMCQSFNKQMASTKHTPIAVGSVMQFGGFNAILKELELGGPVLKGDCSKWDKHFYEKLRRYCKRLRVDLYPGKPGKMSKEEYAARMEWLYWVCTNGSLITPWGQVLKLIMHGMLSGDFNTTYDNTDGHLLICFAYILTYFPNIHSWQELITLANWKLYADDHLMSIVKELSFLSDFRLRERFYARFGHVLKPDDDEVHMDGNWEGMKFLGAYALNYLGQWAPAYDLDRIYAGLSVRRNKRTTKQTPRILYNRTVSLLLLSTFNGKDVYTYIEGYLRFLITKLDARYGTKWYSEAKLEPVLNRIFTDAGSDVTLYVPYVPPYEWSINFWLNFESEDSSLYLGGLCRILEEESSKSLLG